MYIYPNSELWILKGVPFNNSYSDTIYFASLQDQYDYFIAKSKYALTNQYYVHVNTGELKVEKRIGDLQDCNYIMFRNTSFGGKWFYAFITAVEYVNNETTKINFQIDLMQTYFFDITIRQCLIDREHSATDGIGDNIQPEDGFEIDDYVYQEFNVLREGIDDLCVIVICAYSPYDSSSAVYHNAQSIDNTIQHAYFYGYTNNSVGKQQLSAAIYLLNQRNKLDNIIDIYCVPSISVPESYTGWNTGDLMDISDSMSFDNPISGRNYPVHIAKPSIGDTWVDIKGGANLRGYTPKNNKLYTYPFFSFEIGNSVGQKSNYAFEDFDGDDVVIGLIGSITPPVQLTAYPRNYKRVYNVANPYINSEGGISIANFPKVAYAGDNYTAWSAQNSVPLYIDTASSTLSGGISGAIMGGSRFGTKGAIIGGVAGAIGGMATGLANMGSESYKAKNTSDRTRGTVNCSGAMHSNQLNVLTYARKHIPNQMAKIVDDYFTMYGYACNEVKYPNRNVRPYFTYTKTIGANFIGNCPADDVKTINSIYDNGIRFWKSTATVGDYSVNNSPT